mmetsp:Transcript_75777/g.157956  ORF Transcript_75777/g.157956 Transcript_75777/m.157956 type:complete len:254 (-) Transcript_75777:974-1735(-)
MVAAVVPVWDGLTGGADVTQGDRPQEAVAVPDVIDPSRSFSIHRGANTALFGRSNTRAPEMTRFKGLPQLHVLGTLTLPLEATGKLNFPLAWDSDHTCLHLKHSAAGLTFQLAFEDIGVFRLGVEIAGQDERLVWAHERGHCFPDLRHFSSSNLPWKFVRLWAVAGRCHQMHHSHPDNLLRGAMPQPSEACVPPVGGSHFFGRQGLVRRLRAAMPLLKQVHIVSGIVQARAAVQLHCTSHTFQVEDIFLEEQT